MTYKITTQTVQTSAMKAGAGAPDLTPPVPGATLAFMPNISLAPAANGAVEVTCVWSIA